ncbi:S8 family serine peptidase [Streptomyces sp. NPDC015139]|uniref:S8 family serine peptidase n=1 Tax=Streptomyces sp. NPDC015139 TaxID=3364942 RepID=UPI0036FA06DA
MEVRSVLNGLVSEDDLLGDARVCVAVLDGPVDLSHPCFAGADLTRVNTLVQEPAGPGLMSLHGTHVASLLFGQSGTEVFGMVPRCRGLFLPVFRDTESRVSQLDLARAIEQAVQQGAHVINISGGQRTSDGRPGELLDKALRLCADSGVLVVAAAGNDGCDCLQTPAATPSALAVGALGADGKPLELSNWGTAYRSNGVLAPGQDIQGAVPGGGCRKLTGSSFATPAVSGVAALLVAAQLREGRAMDPLAAGQAILGTATADPCFPSDTASCRRHLKGNLNARGAYDLISKRGSAAAVRPDAASALHPLRGGAGHSAVAWAGQGAGHAGGPRPPGMPHFQPNEVINAMDNQPITAHEQAEAAVPDNGDVALEGVAASSEPSGAADEAAGVEAACSGPPEGARSLPAQPVTPGEETTVMAEAAAAAPVPPAGRAGGGSPEGGVRASSGCGCGGTPASVCQCGGNGGNGASQLIYAIGTIGVDFLTEACRDMFRQRMPAVTIPATDKHPEQELPSNPYDGTQLADFLAHEPWLCDKVTWLLQFDGGTAVYALEAEEPVAMDWGGQPLVPPEPPPAPAGRKPGHSATPEELDNRLTYLTDALSRPPVSTIYRLFQEALKGQLLKPKDPNRISRVSVPGELTGRTVRLINGQTVPVVKVKTPGVYTWNETKLVDSVVQAIKDREKANADGPELNTGMSADELATLVSAFLTKLYHQFRNLGQTPGDRALNFAGTNAFLFADSIKDGLLSGELVPGPKGEGKHHLYALDTITVSESPYCRPGSRCMDVTVTFFDPEDDRRAKTRYQYTFDVSYHLPVSLAPVHVFLDR